MGSGLLFLSIRWLGIIILATLVGWEIIHETAPSSPDWVHFGFALLSATMLAVLVHSVRMHTLRRLESLRVQDQLRTEELAVAVAVNEAATFEQAVQIALSRVCALTGWPAGHAYVPREGSPKELLAANIWHFKREGPFQALRQISNGIRVTAGTGLAGWVYASQKPLWLADVGTDPIFARAQLAQKLGLTSAFAFPVREGAEVLAVL